MTANNAENVKKIIIRFRPWRAVNLFPVLAFGTTYDNDWQMFIGWLNLIWSISYELPITKESSDER